MIWLRKHHSEMAGLVLLGLVAVAFSNSAFAATTWTNFSGGLWHENFWSDGLPGEQSVSITNAGSKTIIINNETTSEHPETLLVYGMRISAPDGSTNTLLLDYAGQGTILDVKDILYVEKNAELNLLGSSLKAFILELRGVVSQGDGSDASIEALLQSSNSNYRLLDGTFQTSYLAVGNASSPATFNQFGGTNLCDTFKLLAQYNLWDGTLELASPLQIGFSNSYQNAEFQGATFNQYGGVVNGSLLIGSNHFGSYNLMGGLHRGSVRVLPDAMGAGGAVRQTGGTNIGDIYLKTFFDFFQGVGIHHAEYILENGEVQSSNVSINASTSFHQSGGLHTSGSIGLSGMQFCTKHQPGYDYSNCPIYSGAYQLSGGTLATSSLIIGSGSVFSQSGGQLMVSQLQANGSVNCSGGQASIVQLAVLSGGFFHCGNAMTISNIFLEGGTFQQQGDLIHTGFVIFNSGTWIARAGQQMLGHFFLASTNATNFIIFPTNTCSLNFLASNGITWSNQSQIIVSNWHGSLSGNGEHQLKFGGDANALDPEQVAQIFFQNPSGFFGLYPARILPSGEVVPTFILSVESDGAAQQLRWGAPFILQSSINIDGPYEDVIGATSPYPLEFTEPRRFFRLRDSAASGRAGGAR